MVESKFNSLKRGYKLLKKIIGMCAVATLLSGCFIAPIALIGPASSGFSTASIIQSTISSYANHVVKENTGKTITQHVLDKTYTIRKEDLKLGFQATYTQTKLILPKNKP